MIYKVFDKNGKLVRDCVSLAEAVDVAAGTDATIYQVVATVGKSGAWCSETLERAMRTDAYNAMQTTLRKLQERRSMKGLEQWVARALHLAAEADKLWECLKNGDVKKRETG